MAHVTTRWPRTLEHNKLSGEPLHQAWGAFFGKLPWELFITLTFDPKRVHPVDRRTSDRETLWWCGLVGHLSRRPLHWLFASERGRSGSWHSHVVLMGLSSKEVEAAAMRVWRARNGFCDAKPITDPRTIVLYTTKEAFRTGEVVLCDNLVACRMPLSQKPGLHLFREGAEA